MEALGDVGFALPSFITMWVYVKLGDEKQKTTTQGFLSIYIINPSVSRLSITATVERQRERERESIPSAPENPAKNSWKVEPKVSHSDRRPLLCVYGRSGRTRSNPHESSYSWGLREMLDLKSLPIANKQKNDWYKKFEKSLSKYR